MTITHIPAQQPNDGTLTVREYVLDPKAGFHLVAINDGWRPLCVRSLEHSLILVALVDTGRPEEGEVFSLLLPGDDIRAIQEASGVELAFIGQTWDGRYLFLSVKPEESDTVRRMGRPDSSVRDLL